MKYFTKSFLYYQQGNKSLTNDVVNFEQPGPDVPDRTNTRLRAWYEEERKTFGGIGIGIGVEQEILKNKI